MTFPFTFTQASTISVSVTEPAAVDVTDDDGTIVLDVPPLPTMPTTYYLRTEAGNKLAAQSGDILLIEHA